MTTSSSSTSPTKNLPLRVDGHPRHPLLFATITGIILAAILSLLLFAMSPYWAKNEPLTPTHPSFESVEKLLARAGSITVSGTRNGLSISVSMTQLADGCRFDGTINNVTLPGFKDPKPCSSPLFWAWWASHAHNTVKDTVGKEATKEVESFLLTWIK